MPQFCGPFPIVERPSRTTVKIKVGLDVQGNARYEIRNWRDLKVAHLRPDTKDFLRPKRGRPSKKLATAQSGSDSPTETNQEVQDGAEINKLKLPSPSVKSGGKIETGIDVLRPQRSTRNPNPLYIDSLMWSASEEELNSLNQAISARNRA